MQTFGDLANFNPHVHVLAADGGFRADGAFVPLPPIPEALLEGGFRRAVLEFLVGARAIPEALRSRMLGWRYSGFSAHNQVRVAAQDPEGRKKLAGYMLRAPMSLEKMSYDAATGTVIYRFATRAKAAWARLIRKVYEADPLECPKCKGPMRVIALIDDPGVVRRILEHLGRWAPEPAERGPAAQAPAARNPALAQKKSPAYAGLFRVADRRSLSPGGNGFLPVAAFLRGGQ